MQHFEKQIYFSRYLSNRNLKIITQWNMLLLLSCFIHSLSSYMRLFFWHVIAAAVPYSWSYSLLCNYVQII